MARAPRRPPLNVYLNGRLVGRLRRESSGAIDFIYDPSWLGWENAIPVSHSLPPREDRYVGDPVVAVFDNLLPDNDDIRRRLAERAHADGFDAYSLLAAVGRDCVGALQFVPDGMDAGKAGEVNARAVTDQEIAERIGDLTRNPLGIGDDDREFRISIAGAQEKTALLYWKDKWHVPHGTTATTHILKPQIGHLPDGVDLSNSVENEHLCLELVRALGLPAAKSKIRDFEGKRALVIERFDRIWTKDGRLLRVPQEDCCQALSVPPTRKYESDGGPGVCDLVELLKGSDAPEEDQKTVFKAQVIFWLLGATDGHAKNFSLRLASGGRFRLTPIYDVVSAQPSVDANQIRLNQMKMAMAIGKNRHYIVHTIIGRHFVETGDKCGLSARLVSDAIQEICDTGKARIDAVIAGLPADFPGHVAQSISNGAKHRIDLLATPNIAKVDVV
ncbi:toxin HipA [Methyloceanibacter methanicus]|uniref:Toxin HipA n=1 Tax=Methyloceanibacter methanicus TaxID=1774968 RepID=A0A1E3W1H3_9HYPH|nr:type II toxin-antitoxin system HipA family toxin [Methyloceanibacter methanicus]ODR99371.1 toxin HipA [Methyloceanibacter methanicus]